MGYTISFSQGRVAEKHDKREGENLPKNIDSKLTKNNRDFTPQQYVNKDYKTCFNEYFQNSVDANNAKQNREARKIHDYYAHIAHGKGKQKPLYEYVLQIGNHADNSLGDTDEAKLMRYALEKTLQKLPGAFPNFEFVLIRTHADEPNGSYHAHICFFPHADGYKTGLPVRCALKEAFKQMGYDTTKGARYLKDFKQTVEEMLEKEMKVVKLERAYGDGGFSNDSADKSNRNHMIVQDYILHREAEKKYAEAEAKAKELDKREKSLEAEIELKYKKLYEDDKKALSDEFEAFKRDLEDNNNQVIQNAIKEQKKILEEEFEQYKKDEFKKMKASLSEYKKKYESDYKNEQETKFQELQDGLEAQNKVKLEEALKEQVSDVKEYRQWKRSRDLRFDDTSESSKTLENQGV